MKKKKTEKLTEKLFNLIGWAMYDKILAAITTATTATAAVSSSSKFFIMSTEFDKNISD